MTRSRLFLAFALAAASTAGAACTLKGPGVEHLTPVDPPDDWYGDPPAEQEPIGTNVDDDSGAFGVGSRPKPPPGDGGSDAAAPHDGGTVLAPPCTGPLAAGDLVIDEVMVASRAGSGDDGEWIEVANARSCTLTVQGVTIASPRGTSSDGFTITTPLTLRPGETFVVADSADPAKNHGLSGTVFAWSATDVLKNDGDTVSLTIGTTTIDAFTYPALSGVPDGSSIAFPSDCPAADRTSLARWSVSFGHYATGFAGTPNAPNDDVACF